MQNDGSHCKRASGHIVLFEDLFYTGLDLYNILYREKQGMQIADT